MKNKPLTKWLNYFFVYLPVIWLVSLITTVYWSYLFTYINFMIKADETMDPNRYFLTFTSSVRTAKAKGYILLFLSLALITMLYISLFKTVFSNPGYFPNPLHLEYKIISTEANTHKDNENYLSKISDYWFNGPMTDTEKSMIERKLRTKYFEQMKENPWTWKYSNEEIFERNKKEYNSNMNNSVTVETKCCVSSNSEVYLDIYKDIDWTKMTLCGTCLRIKVERSHHCRQCQRCVLKMDHHCPWLANCIGFGNLKSFILVQFYGILNCSWVALTYWESVVDYNMNWNTNWAECWYAISVYLMNLGLLAFLWWWCIINWTNLFNGWTVIENSEKQRFPTTKLENIYDMGPYRNFTNVFGENPLVWFIPFFHNKNGSGYVFETNKNNFYIK